MSDFKPFSFCAGIISATMLVLIMAAFHKIESLEKQLKEPQKIERSCNG